VAAVAALALDPLDLTSLEPATQVTCVETMTRLLCSLELPLQFLVRRRRLVITDVQTATAGPIAAALDAAVLRHQAEMLAARPAFRSSVLAVMRRDDGDVAALHRQLAMASEMLRSAGLRPRAVSDGELALPDAVEAGQASAGVVRERIRCVAVAGGARCGLELERLPGRAVTLGWAGAMLAAAAEFDAAIHLMPIDAAAAHRAVERRLRNLTADRLLEIDRGRIGDARVDVGLEAAGSLRERLRAVLEIWLTYVEAHAYAWKMLFRDTGGGPEVHAFRQEVHDRAREVLVEMIRPPGESRIRCRSSSAEASKINSSKRVMLTGKMSSSMTTKRQPKVASYCSISRCRA